jgi:hypothetical protein
MFRASGGKPVYWEFATPIYVTPGRLAFVQGLPEEGT